MVTLEVDRGGLRRRSPGLRRDGYATCALLWLPIITDLCSRVEFIGRTPNMPTCANPHALLAEKNSNCVRNCLGGGWQKRR